MEQAITDHLCELFKPTAIILHGSRASGHAREHSDWDYVLIYEHEAGRVLPKNGRLFWNDQNIEHSHHRLPIEDVQKEFSIKLQNARVVFEKGSEGTQLLAAATDAYAQPLSWSTEERRSHSLWMQGRIDGMRDCIDSPLLFEKYAADFYGRITSYWYWAVQGSFSKPMYIAIEEIKEKDSVYFDLISQYVMAKDFSKKIAVAIKIKEKCFA